MLSGEKYRLVLSIIGWCAMAAYLVFTTRMCRGQEESLRLQGTVVVVSDRNDIPIVDEQAVMDWMGEFRPLRDSMPLADIDTRELVKYIETKPFVRSARAYTDMNGILTVVVSQRKPIARFSLRGGYDFYVSDDMYILPAVTGGSISVPMVTGNFMLPFGKGFSGKIDTAAEENTNFTPENYLYFTKLINFVRLVGSSPFWDAQIVQINVEAGSSVRWKEPEIELVPRVGRHLIILGDLEDTQGKLDKLMLFYNRVLDYEGWEAYRTINLKYKDQIVCTRR